MVVMMPSLFYSITFDIQEIFMNTNCDFGTPVLIHICNFMLRLRLSRTPPVRNPFPIVRNFAGHPVNGDHFSLNSKDFYEVICQFPIPVRYSSNMKLAAESW